MNDHYSWRGGRGMLLRHGHVSPLTLLVLPALFEEANRMRRFTVSLMRTLAIRGVGTLLPDLPGTGESLTPLIDVTLADWEESIATLAEQLRQTDGRCLTVSVRGGAMLDTPADFGWRLAPETGERMLRDLVRATALGSSLTATEIDGAARSVPTALVGQTMSPAMYNALSQAALRPDKRRTARLVEDIGLRDVSLQGTKLWRSAEPGDDPLLVEAAANDIVDWVAKCAKS